jgi:hypothetical protein
MAEKANGPKAPAAKSISKTEAVRRALARFGRDATPLQMQPWIKSEFGITMSANHISASKGKLLGKKKPAAKTAAPKPAASNATAARADGISKLEGVRRVLAEFGPDTKPVQIQAHLKSRFGIPISVDVASTYKKLVARQAKAGKKTRTPKAAFPTSQASSTASTAARPKAAGAGVSLDDLGAVKELVGRVGAESLRTLIDLFAR